jgi:hypothetical protein
MNAHGKMVATSVRMQGPKTGHGDDGGDEGGDDTTTPPATGTTPTTGTTRAR